MAEPFLALAAEAGTPARYIGYFLPLPLQHDSRLRRYNAGLGHNRAGEDTAVGQKSQLLASRIGLSAAEVADAGTELRAFSFPNSSQWPTYSLGTAVSAAGAALVECSSLTTRLAASWNRS